MYFSVDIANRKVVAETMGQDFDIIRLTEYTIHAERTVDLGNAIEAIEELTLDRRTLELLTQMVTKTSVRSYMVNCGIAPEKVL